MKRFTRAQAREIDRRWHEFQMAANARDHARQHLSSRINFGILGSMPPAVAELIDQLGPDAPEWANEWFATGEDPRVPVFPSP